MLKIGFLRAKMILAALLILHSGLFAQLRTITGTVKDDKGTTLAKATISGKGVKEVLSDADGNFIITVPASVLSLTISFAEYGTQKINLKGLSKVVVILKPSIAVMDSVVVVGYGTQKRKDVTGAIASVRGETIKNLPVQNIAEAIQGRIAGVDVTKSSGEPGTAAQITIRGVSSLNQPNPLYIIDGVRQPTEFGATAGSNINPQDIASIDVLKDASAASIYGAAAAGGVILITTKKGQGPPAINLSTRYSITTPRVLKLLDKAEFIRIKQLTDPAGYYALNDRLDTLPNTDWVDAVFRNGIEQNYNLSVSGANNNVNYFISGGYNDQKGVYLNNSSNIYNFRVNTDVKLNNHIKIGEQIEGWQRQTSPVDYGSSAGGVTLSPRLNPPFRTVPTMDIYGKNPGEWGVNPSGFSGPNIIGQILTKSRSIKQSNVQANAYVEIKLPLALTLRGTLGYTIFNEEGNNYEGILRTQVDAVTAPQLLRHIVTYRNLLNAFTLSHDKSYGKNNINALVGYEQYRGVYSGLFTSETYAGGGSYAYIATTNTQINVANGGYDPNPLVKSIFARLNYNFNNKYFISLSARRDGDFIKFAPGHQYGIFPAASVGWRISDEDFFKKIAPAVSLLKLRGSYGLVGNSAIPAYAFLNTYDLVNQQNFAPGGQPILGYTQNTLANPEIRWESLYETNIGVDGDLFKGKIFFSVDWYDKTTKNMLYKLPLPPSDGLSGLNDDPANPPFVYTNVGSVSNKGLDILLGYRNHHKDLDYSVSFTGSFNKNKVTDLAGTYSKAIIDGNNNYGNSQGAMFGQSITYTAVGLPFGQFYGFKALGIRDVDQTSGPEFGDASSSRKAKAGDLIYEDVNGDGFINDKDRTVIGNPYPKFTYGVSINLSWKGFDLSMLLNGVAGVDIFNGVSPYSQSLWSDGNTTSKVFGASYLGGNGLTSQPRIGVLDPNGVSFAPDPNGNYRLANSYFVENGSYVKLKNVQLGYNLSAKLLGRARIKTAKIFVMGNNLFAITKYSGIDPELGSQNLGTNGGTTNRGIDGPYKYPSTRIYSFGLNLTF